MKSKLGQLSVETMIIYGLVILVALSVIAGLLYFGVLDIGSYLPESCDLGGTGDLKCEEFSFGGTGTIQLGIRNIGQKPIEVLSVQVTDSDSLHFSAIVSGDGTVDGAPISTTNTLAPGDIALVTVNAGDIEPGKVLRAKIVTSYKYKEGAVTQETVGSLRIKAAG